MTYGANMEPHDGRGGRWGGPGEGEERHDFSAHDDTTEVHQPIERSGAEAHQPDAPSDPPGDGGRVPASLSDDELERLLLETIRHINVLEARLVSGAVQFHRRRIADDRYVLTTKQWLQHAGRLSPSRAATVLRVGAALDEMPTAAEYAAEGLITPDGLRMLTAARHDHPSDFAIHEEVLADAATTLGTKDLRRAIDHWEQQVAYPSVLDEIAAKQRRRRLSCNQTWDGMWSINGILDPESGHIVNTALRARIGSAQLDPIDNRSPGQRTADALVEVCSHALDHGETTETSGGAKPHVTVMLDYETLTVEPGTAPDRPLPEVDGLPISPEDARRIACDAGVVRIITKGDSAILDVGRSTRTIPPAIRRAVEHRDGGCAWAGCDADIRWCDVHHIIHWALGGETVIANLILLCRRHHTAIHDGRSPP